jgi:hypothetical protein
MADAATFGTNFLPINAYFSPQYPHLFHVIHVRVGPDAPVPGFDSDSE